MMDMNGGSKFISQGGKWKGYGTAYYIPDAMVNIVSLSNAIEKGFQVFMDTDLDNAFNVTDQDKRTIRFPCNKQGLYMLKKKINQGEKSKRHTVMASIIERYTPRELARAKQAKKLYHDLHAETISNLKGWLSSNMGKNIPVLFEDVNLMGKLFQKDVTMLKGKSVKPHPPVVNNNDMIELPPKLNVRGKKVKLAIDVVYINDQSFLHSVDLTIKMRALSHLGMRKKGQNHDKGMLFGAWIKCSGVTIKMIYLFQ